MSQGGIISATGSNPGIPSSFVEDVGVATPAANILNIVGGSGIQTTGAGNTVTISNSLGLGQFPITPFVVGPIGLAGYQTIQSALDAANAAGGGAVYVQPSGSPYIENLILYNNVSIVGVSGNSDVIGVGDTVTIQGVHTPPTDGYLSIKNCFLQSSTSIFFSASAGTAQIVVANCVMDVANGYIWDLDQWMVPGAMIGFNNQDVGLGNNGVINNTAQATVYLQDSVKGSGAGSMLCSGPITMKNCDFNIPITFFKNGIDNIDNCRFNGTVTADINSTGIINFSRFNPVGATPCFVMSSTDPIRLSNCLFNTSNNPCIAGSGAGQLSLTCATFIDNAIIAGTVNIASASAFLPASFGTLGQVFSSNGPGVIPAFATVTSTGGTISITPSPGSLNLDVIGGGFPWTDVTTATQALLVENGYFTDRGAGVTYTLPTTAVLGAVIKINGKLGLTTIAQNAGQSIRWSSAITTVGVTGTSVGTNVGDCVTLRCSTANTGWIAESFNGSWNIT